MVKATKTQDMKERDEVGMLLGRFERYWQNIRPRIAAWKEYYKVIQFFRETGPRSYKYNYAFPIAFTFAENFISSIMNPLFESPQTIEIVPTEGFSYLHGMGVNDAALARQLERALKHFLDGPDSEFYESFEDMVRMLAYYGTGIAQVVPGFGTMTNPDKFIGPKIEVIELWDALLPPGTRKLKMGVEFFMREVVTRAELQRRERIGRYTGVNEVFESPKPGDDDVHSQILSEMGIEGLVDADDDAPPDPNGRILLIHHYDTEGHCQIIAGGRKVVYSSRRPQKFQLADGRTLEYSRKPFDYFPFESIRMGQGPKDFYGIGIGQVTKQTQDSINIRHSQKVQASEMHLFKTILYNMNRDLDIRHLYTGPGHVIPVHDLNDTLQVLDSGHSPPEMFQLDNQEWRYGEEASGSQAIARGNSPGGRVTATGSSQLLQSSQQRFSMSGSKLARMQASAARKTIAMIPRHMSRREYERIIGEPDAGLFSLPIEDIVLGLDFRPRVPTLSGSQRQQRLNILVNFLQIAAQVPVVQTASVIYELTREMFPDRDPRTFLLPEVIEYVNTLGQLGQSTGVKPGEGPPAVPDGSNYRTTPGSESMGAQAA